MKFNLRIPRVAASTVDGSLGTGTPVLDGSDVTLPNDWKLPAHTVALIGRPAVWIALDFTVPIPSLRPPRIASRHVRLEQDFGGHLLVAIVDADASSVRIVEAGPRNADGTGALVPYRYPEDAFAKRGVTDFEPIPIAPPHGLREEAFAALVERTQRAYDGDQRYLVIEIPFLRVGRDSNSYAVGVLLAAGVDPRAMPKPRKPLRFEWTGYPGAEDPVHRGNFGTYLGAPRPLGDALEIAYHDEDGGVRLVAIGGTPNGRVRLPDGDDVTLDAFGRIVFDARDAKRHGLPTKHTPVPDTIARRRRFPTDPQAAGAEITLVVDGRSVALRPGTRYRGRVVARNDALGIAFLRTDTEHDVVLPLAELSVELRDPKRVDRLVRVGNELTIGLHRDRHPWLVAHGPAASGDRFRFRRPHVPRPSRVVAAACALVAIATCGVWFERR